MTLLQPTFPAEKLLGKFLALRPIRFALVALAKLRPYSWLKDQDGSVYMERSRAWDDIGGTHARVHRIMRPDHDRDLHNHPFDYRTFVLDGWYIEVYLDAHGVERSRTISAGQTAYSSGTFHRIAAVSPGGVTTLFVMGPDSGRWWFRKELPADGVRRRFKFVESHEYFKQRGAGPQAVEA
jgi:hypothetical protein